MDLPNVFCISADRFQNHQYQFLPVIPCDEACEAAQSGGGYTNASLDVYKVFPGKKLLPHYCTATQIHFILAYAS